MGIYKRTKTEMKMTAEEKLQKKFRGWYPLVENFFKSAEYEALVQFLKGRVAAGAEITPAKENIFAAYDCPQPENVKVVLIGQDPYPHYHAHGLSFSSLSPNTPASLKNIFKQLNDEYKDELPQDIEYHHENDLSRWAVQGVLLLNTVLTSEVGGAGAHLGQGWESMTSRSLVNLIRGNFKPHVVFILLGKKAQDFVATQVETRLTPEELSRVKKLETSHPSPYSANSGFIGSNIFTECNKILEADGEKPIDWIGPMINHLPF